ncbi:MAG: hypothetical protein AAF491_05730 [Verrucomicrobiota bacterium]
MKYLFFLKRFEIWLLLGIVVALLVFAFQPVEEEAGSEGETREGELVVSGVVSGVGSEAEAEPEKAPKGITVRKVDVEMTGSGRIVEVTFLARGESEETVPVNEATLIASTSEGMQVPHFFTPFQPEQEVAPGEESLIIVKFWLAETTDSIWLDFGGERAEAELPEEL